MVKISTEINSTAQIVGEECAVEMVARAGFDGWDLSMFSMCRYDGRDRPLLPNDHPLAGNGYLSFVRKLKQIGLDNGIVCNQAHAPYPVYCPPIRDYLMRAIECAAEAGAQICVIHPDNNASPEENAKMYRQLLPFAKSCGVKIATENMWNRDPVTQKLTVAACATPKSFCDHIDVVNDPDFVACLDVGHAELEGMGTSAAEMILALGHRLQALHLHDNDHISDLHLRPFDGSVHFPSVVDALKKIGYRGWFTMEAYGYVNGLEPAQTLAGLQKLTSAGRKLANMFENAKDGYLPHY